MTASDSLIERCFEKRTKASKTVMIGRRRVKRFLGMDAPDDGTLRCICCGQIDDEPWHDPALCPAIVEARALASEADLRAKEASQ